MEFFHFKENIGLILDKEGHLASKDEEKSFNAFFLSHFLKFMVDLGLPGPQNWMPMTWGAATFHLWATQL